MKKVSHERIEKYRAEERKLEKLKYLAVNQSTEIKCDQEAYIININQEFQTMMTM